MTSVWGVDLDVVVVPGSELSCFITGIEKWLVLVSGSK